MIATLPSRHPVGTQLAQLPSRHPVGTQSAQLPSRHPVVNSVSELGAQITTEQRVVASAESNTFFLKFYTTSWLDNPGKINGYLVKSVHNARDDDFLNVQSSHLFSLANDWHGPVIGSVLFGLGWSNHTTSNCVE